MSVLKKSLDKKMLYLISEQEFIPTYAGELQINPLSLQCSNPRENQMKNNVVMCIFLTYNNRIFPQKSS